MCDHWDPALKNSFKYISKVLCSVVCIAKPCQNHIDLRPTPYTFLGTGCLPCSTWSWLPSLHRASILKDTLLEVLARDTDPA